MISYLFVFGRTPNLSFLELTSFFPDASLLCPNVAFLEVADTKRLSPVSLLATLGGTVKIAEIIGQVPQITVTTLGAVLAAAMGNTKRIVFGISSYDPHTTVGTKILADTKKSLESKGYAARFVTGRDGEPLSSVVITKQKVTEYIIAGKDNVILIAKILAVQDFEAWNMRDRGRPYGDPKSGMLPPKVARMVVNIAKRGSRPASPAGGQARTMTLFDPFCGMGTILAEALLSGWNVVGSDLSAEVIDKARKNLEWLEGSHPSRKDAILPAVKWFVSDATHVSEHLERESVDAIVTEPFMGPTRLGGNNPISQSDQWKTIKNTVKGLEKLYIGCLKDWHKILKPGGRVVMALPAFRIGERTMFVKKVIDSCENLGYTKRVGPIEYSRPQAVVRREFFVLQKK